MNKITEGKVDVSSISFHLTTGRPAAVPQCSAQPGPAAWPEP